MLTVTRVHRTSVVVRRLVAWLCGAVLVSMAGTLAADSSNVPSIAAPTAVSPIVCWAENFDSLVTPALPPAWTSVAQSGTPTPWLTVATGADTAPNRVTTGNPATVSDNHLVSQVITMPPGATTLSFRHSFNTETGFDGGVLEISLNSGGTYADIVNAGGSFVAGGYNATLSASFGNPLGSRQAWSGNSGGFVTTTISFPSAIFGEGIRLRWRMGTDSTTAGGGWSIDTVTIAAEGCGTGSAPGTFSKLVPANNAVAQPTDVTLMWAPSTGASSYEYCIDTTNNSSCAGWTSSGAGTSAALTDLAPATTYYWQVRATNVGGTIYANNVALAHWRFTTQADPPGAFGKTTPLGGATNRATTLTLNWTASAGATGYEVCIDKTNNGACGSVWEPAGASTSVTIKNLDPSTLHSWHVRALNSGGTTYADAGATAFTAFKTAPASRIPLVDFDGNGTGDVLVQELSTGQWSWQRYQPGGAFLETGGNQGPDSITTPMLNSEVVDARTDGTRFNTVTGYYQRLLSNGLTFSGTSTSEIWWPGWQRHVLDLDSDGISDFFLYDPATGAWFQCPAIPTGPGNCHQGGWNPGWEIYAMRLNDDAFGDFFLINRTTGRWFWALGTGGSSWNFTYPVTETWFTGWNIYPGDYNGDGLSDLLLHDPATGVYFVASSTGAGFTYASGGWALAWTPLVADLNGDGMDDVFRHDPATGNWTQMISDGAGGFTKVGTGTWSLGWQIHPTDFDGDGRADFLLYHPQTGVWYQARNTAPGVFAYTSGVWKPNLMISTGAIGR